MSARKCGVKYWRLLTSSRSFYQLDVRDEKAVISAVGGSGFYRCKNTANFSFTADGVVRDYGGVDILLTSAGVADNVGELFISLINQLTRTDCC